jgi:RNA polymerase sigma-70 factor (ECF subfamily)
VHVTDAGDPSPASAARVGAWSPEPWRGELAAFLRRLGAGPEAEDLVQEAFLRALERPPRGNARGWLYQVALNLMRDRGRRERVGDRVLEQAWKGDVAPEAGPPARAEAAETVARVWSAVAVLPESQRLALYLRAQAELSYDEIGVALECSAATARQHFHLAVKAMRRLMLGGSDD